MEVFDRIVSVVSGFVAFILFTHVLQVDWQLALMSIRDATAGRWVPEFRVDADLNKLKMMFSR